MDVTARILSAAQDEKQLDDLISDYTAFIKACIAKYGTSSSGNITIQIDDLLTVGQMGFIEAVKSFDPEKGNFFSFASLVIKRRLIEENKRDKKWQDNVVYLNNTGTEDHFSQKSMVQFQDNSEKTDLVYEIRQLKDRLSQFDIDFVQLARISPKHKSSKELCLRAVKFLLNHDDLCDSVLSNGKLPYNLLLEKAQVNRKILERQRKYILAVLVIQKEDYVRLKAYIPISS